MKGSLFNDENKEKKKIILLAGIAATVILLIVVFVICQNYANKNKRAENKTDKEGRVEETVEESTVDPDYRPLLQKEDVFSHYPKELVLVGAIDPFLDIHRDASADSAVIGKLLPYSYVNAVNYLENGWTQIESQGVNGYVITDALITGEEARTLALEHCMHRVQAVKDEVIGVDGMSEEANKLVTLVNGNFYDVVKDNQKGWILVHARHNTECYVSEEDVLDGYFLNEAIMFTSDGEISDLRLDFLNNAWQYLGGKYVWGGEQLGAGVDCSGYIWKLLEQYGIYIHRVSIEQAQDGREVTEEEMRPGDFIFYIVKGDKISHVAIYTGSGRIIHAASEERGIVIDPWDYQIPQAIRNVFD